MESIERIAERIRQSFESRTEARDKALSQTRQLTRLCATAIRAIHRDEQEHAKTLLNEAHQLVQSLRSTLDGYPDLYFAGYTQDALKEYAEANIFFALCQNDKLPEPEDLGIEYATYIQGLAESTGELRRRCLDLIRHGRAPEAERFLNYMDDIYTVLITMDYPDAITGGLRRLTDLVRGITERTRGDLTISLRQEHLEENLRHLEEQL